MTLKEISGGDLSPTDGLPHFLLLERAASVFCHSPDVTSLLLRGSLASGTADWMSDIDLVVGVRDVGWKRVVRVLDALITVELGALLPGWRDTYVSKLGGLGYVYLVIFEGKLYEFDVYVAPESLVPALQDRVKARLLYAAQGEPSRPLPPSRLNKFVEAELTRAQTCAELLVEMLVFTHFLRKRIMRRQPFIIYADTNLLINTVKNFIKTSLAPASGYWGWYHLMEDIGNTPVGRACLEDLSALISGSQIRTMEGLLGLFDRAMGVVARAAPEVFESFGREIKAYRHYLGFHESPTPGNEEQREQSA